MNAESYSLNQSFGQCARNIQTTIHGKRCLSLNNSADYGKRFHTSFYEDNIHLNTSARKAHSTHKTKPTRMNRLFTDNKNSTRFIVNPASPFLEEMYWKYSKSLQRYFSRNKEGMKLYGNKYFENISIDAFLRTRGASQKKMLAKLKNLKETAQTANTNVNVNATETEFYLNDNGVNIKNYKNNKMMFNKVNNVINEELTDDEFFLTPLPNKSRKLLVTKKEKGEFLKAERAAVMMRTFEYTHGIRSRVGFNQYNKMIEEEKQRLMSLMLGAANKIQQWWKRRRNINHNNNAIYEKDSDDTDSDMFTQRYNEYLQVLEKKKKQNLIDKIIKYIHKYNTIHNKKEFIDKFKEYCKSVSKKKNVKYINNWNEVILICDNGCFSICADVVVKERVKSKISVITKYIYGNRNGSIYSKGGNLVSVKDVLMCGGGGGNDSEGRKECLGYTELIEKVIMLQRCVKNYLQYVNYKRVENAVKEHSMNDAFGFVNRDNISQSKELYSNRNTNLKTKLKRNQINLMQHFVKNIIKDKNDIITEEDNDDYNNNNNDSDVIDDSQGVSGDIRYRNDNKYGNDSERNNKKFNTEKIEMNDYLKGIGNLNEPFAHKQNINTHNYDENNNNNGDDYYLNGEDVNELKDERNRNNNNNINDKYTNTNNKDVPQKTSKTISRKVPASSTSTSASSLSMGTYSTKPNNQIPSNESNTKKQSSRTSKGRNILSDSDTNKHPIIANNNNNNNINPNDRKHSLKNPTSIYSLNILNNKNQSTDINKDNPNNINNTTKDNKRRTSYQQNQSQLQLPSIPTSDPTNNKQIISSSKTKPAIPSTSTKPSSHPEQLIITSTTNPTQHELIPFTQPIQPYSPSPSTNSHPLSSSSQPNHSILPSYILSTINSTSYFNFIHKPSSITFGNFISKLRKQTFSTTINSKLKNLLQFKLTSSKRIPHTHLSLIFHKWKTSSNYFKTNTNKLLKTIIKTNNKQILSIYFTKWLTYVYKVYDFIHLIKLHIIKDNIDLFIQNMKTEDKRQVCSYSHTITSIANTQYNNNNQSQHFRYYCKINKSNNENDFLIIRMSLGYKLLREVFTRGLGHELLIRLKKRKRRQKKSKTLHVLGKLTSRRHFEFLNANFKLLMTIKRIVTNKFYSEFYHKLIYIALHRNNNIEFNLKNSEICLLIREGYRKGYFTILYNILKERFAYVYYESGLSFEDFVRGILTMEHSENHNEYVYYLPQGSEEEKDGYEEDENEYE